MANFTNYNSFQDVLASSLFITMNEGYGVFYYMFEDALYQLIEECPNILITDLPNKEDETIEHTIHMIQVLDLEYKLFSCSYNELSQMYLREYS